jgi:hypothetical protein
MILVSLQVRVSLPDCVEDFDWTGQSSTCIVYGVVRPQCLRMLGLSDMEIAAKITLWGYVTHHRT